MHKLLLAAMLPLALLRATHAESAATLEPARFGAVGDGRSHAIGTADGATLAALAAHSVDGAKPFAWVTDPVYGLTFSRATLAAQERPATELRFSAIAGPVGAGAQMIVPGMIASAPCLPAGDTVASVPAPGAVRLATPSRAVCAAGTLVSFALSPGQVQTLQADWLGIQAAIAAAHALPTGGAVHIPRGEYLVNRPVVNPGGIRDTFAVAPEVDVYGDGLAQTRIVFTTDLGSGACGFGATDRGVGSTSRASIHDLRLIGPGRRGAIGVSPAAMDGVCVGAKEVLRRVRSDGFHAGANVLEDHWVIEQCELSNNLYGIYLAPGGDTFGNGVLRDDHLGGNLLASIAIASSNVLDSATLQNLDLGFVPYGFYREPAPAGSVALGGFISNSLLENVWGESLGNGYIYGENGGRDRVERNTWINDAPVMDLAGDVRLPGRPAEALVRVGAWTDNDMIGSDFGNPNNYRMVTRALILAEDEIQGNDFGRAPDMVSGSSAARPALRGRVMLFNRFATGQAQGRWLTATAGVRAGEMLAEAGFDRAAPAAPGLPLAGVAMAAADAEGAVPVCDRGVVRAAKSAFALHRGERVGVASDDPTTVAPVASDAAGFATVWETAPQDSPDVTIVIGPSIR